MLGIDLADQSGRFYHSMDRFVWPVVVGCGRPIPFERLDSITQLGTARFDACLFFNDGDTTAHRILYDNPNFHTVAYVPHGNATEKNDPVNAVLVPFSVHDEADLTAELLAIYRRDLSIALKESGAAEIHLRRHPGRDVRFLEHLAADIAAGGVPCRLVGAERPISIEAARYRGVLGAVSGSLRDVRLSCPHIFVVGSMGLSQTHFRIPKAIIGFPDSIGWIEADGTYDAAIFLPRKVSGGFPTLPEKIDMLLAQRRQTAGTES
jgi:hypothetical protein